LPGRLRWLTRWLLTLTLALALALIAPVTFADPPERVARLSVISGTVSFAIADDDTWHEASLNRPLVIGDRLYTERDARTELDLGTAVVRMDERSDLRLFNLDNQTAKFELAEGTLNLSVRKLYEDQYYQIDTPTLALVIREPGAYRIDARDGVTQVTVFEGDADVYGENDAQHRVSARQSYRFPDASLRDYAAFDLPRADAFDDWCFARDERYDNPVARRYVSDDVVGYADLDDYGDWQEESSYGPVWYPRRVVTDWAPYRDGHWAWVQPWGWTWVDSAPWGFAPSHYGRWICVRERWGWVPGPRTVRPVYAPAVVAFIGGNHWHDGYADDRNPVGWYPLGPQDIYSPSYQVSQTYFRDVNVTNIHNTTVINKTIINNVYNDYAAGRPARNARHAHRQNLKAVTAVERDTFVNARPVARAQKKLKAEDLKRAEVINRPTLTQPYRSAPGRAAPTTQITHNRRHDGRTTTSMPSLTSKQQPALNSHAGATPAPRTWKSQRVESPAERRRLETGNNSSARPQPGRDNRPANVAVEKSAGKRAQPQTFAATRETPALKAPTRETRFRTTTPAVKPIMPRAATMTARETHRSNIASERPIVRNEQHRSAPVPIKPRHEAHQTRQAERSSQPAVSTRQRQTVETVAREDAAERAQATLRGKRADARQGTTGWR
jgi:hypothetical protein